MAQSYRKHALALRNNADTLISCAAVRAAAEIAHHNNGAVTAEAVEAAIGFFADQLVDAINMLPQTDGLSGVSTYRALVAMDHGDDEC